MNALIGKIKTIQTSNSLSLVKVEVEETIFTSIVIDTAETLNYLKVGNEVTLFFKETEVIIAKTTDISISVQNKLLCKISRINQGEILSEISLEFGKKILKSIITTNACKQLNLQENDEVMALIKTNEISLAEND